MNRFQLLIRSKTFWTLTVTFIYFGLVGVSKSIPNIPGLDAVIGGLSYLLINYFKANPSANFNSPEVQAQPLPTV
jgi:hypothetical protein